MIISYNKLIYDIENIRISSIYVDKNLKSFSKAQILWNIEYA